MITIYTDGACSGNPGPGGWAAVLRDEDTGRTKELSGHRPQTTNNEMELAAVLNGLVAIRVTGIHVVVYTDSANVVGWLAQGWKCKTPHLRKLLDDIREVILNKDLYTESRKVQAHTGDPLNERANALAQAATIRSQP